MTVLLIALGAAVGAPARYLADRMVQRRRDSVFPWGTFIVNVTGSALLGFLAALPGHGAAATVTGTAFCGAFTTYSTFGYEPSGWPRTGPGCSPRSTLPPASSPRSAPPISAWRSLTPSPPKKGCSQGKPRTRHGILGGG